MNRPSKTVYCILLAFTLLVILVLPIGIKNKTSNVGANSWHSVPRASLLASTAPQRRVSGLGLSAGTPGITAQAVKDHPLLSRARQ